MTGPGVGGAAALLDRVAGLLDASSEVLRGDDVLAALEEVETTKSGIFVMPKERITIERAVASRDHHREL